MKAKKMVKLIVGAVVLMMAFGFLAPAFANAEEIGGIDFERKCAIEGEHSFTYICGEEATDTTPGFVINMCTFCGMSQKIYTTERLTEEWNDEYRYLSPSEEVQEYNAKQEQRFNLKQAELTEKYNNGEAVSIFTENVNLEDILPSILAEYGIVATTNTLEATPEEEIEITEEQIDDTVRAEEEEEEATELTATAYTLEEATVIDTEPSKSEPVVQEVDNPNPNTGNANLIGGVTVVTLGLMIVLACAVIAHRRQTTK